MTGRLRVSLLISFLCCLWMRAAPSNTALAQGPGGRNIVIAETDDIKVGASTLQVDFAEGALDLPKSAILAHVVAAASAVATYYGSFPVASARVLIIPVAGRHGVLQGTTWGDMRGFPAFTRMRVGEHTTQADLNDDWMMTHELVHSAFPSMPDDQHWIEEGLATYVEPIARVMTGELTAKTIWSDMFRDVHQGEPAPGDEGLDRTHTWGRTYWGGAMFCLVADVEIRKATRNRKGLQDALRGIVEAGGTIDHDWTLPQALAIGDRTTKTHVLTRLYDDWKGKPVQVDLPNLWNELGVQAGPNGIEFVDTAPSAKVREAITKLRGAPAKVTLLPGRSE